MNRHSFYDLSDAPRQERFTDGNIRMRRSRAKLAVMRLLVVGLVLGTTIASADPAPEYTQRWRDPNTSGAFIEVGGGWQRINPNGITYRAEYLRIAPQVSINRFLYLGAAMQLGRIYGAYGSLDPVPAAVPANDYTDEGNGSTLAGQVFIGVRDLIGIVSVGGEVAPTLRSTSAGMNFEYAADKSNVTTIELHGRADVWATPHLTAGVLVGMDIASIRDFQAGLQVGFHFEPYDAIKNP
jgi:hypothetical protein